MKLALTIHTPANYFTVDQWNGVLSSLLSPVDDQIIAAGETVEYMAHLAGGMVKVRHKGEPVVIHPAVTNELETALARAIRLSGPAIPTERQGFA